MSFQEFTEYVKEHIGKYLPEEYKNRDFETVSVTRTNNQKKTGLSICEECGITPTMYLEEFFDEYRAGLSLAYILRKMAEEYVKSLEEIKNVFPTDFRYEDVQDNIIVGVRNIELNKEILKNAPHEIMEDLALVYLIDFKLPGGRGKTVITNSLLDYWGVDEETVKKTAWKNVYRDYEPVFIKLSDILRQMGVPMDGIELEDDIQYVLTNEQKYEAAAYLFDKACMKKISEELGTDMLVLPSSIHELIFIEMNDNICLKDFQSMVREINETKVCSEEVLSNEIYIFRYGSQTLERIVGLDEKQGMGMTM